MSKKPRRFQHRPTPERPHRALGQSPSLWDLAEKQMLAEEAVERGEAAAPTVAPASATPEPIPVLTEQELEICGNVKADMNRIPNLDRRHTDQPKAEIPVPPQGQRPPRATLLTEAQQEAIYAEIEDLMILSGRHRDDVCTYLQKTYDIRYYTARWWITKTLHRWQAAQDTAKLADKHYQLERMGHALYHRAMEGPTWREIKEQLGRVEHLLTDGKVAEAQKAVNELVKSKGADIRTAQRILAHLAACAGLGNRITLDLSGAGISIEDKK